MSQNSLVRTFLDLDRIQASWHEGRGMEYLGSAGFIPSKVDEGEARDRTSYSSQRPGTQEQTTFPGNQCWTLNLNSSFNSPDDHNRLQDEEE